MFRNCAPYCAGKAGSVLAGLFLALRTAPKELAAVVERTVEEVVDRLPCDLALSVRFGGRWRAAFARSPIQRPHPLPAPCLPAPPPPPLPFPCSTS